MASIPHAIYRGLGFHPDTDPSRLTSTASEPGLPNYNNSNTPASPLSIASALAPTLPALLVSLCILALLFALILLLDMRARRRIARQQRPRHRLGGRRRRRRATVSSVSSRHRRSLYDLTGLHVVDPDAPADPRSTSSTALMSQIARPHGQSLLLERYLDALEDDAEFELDDATWQKPEVNSEKSKVMHWHGSNTLNTSWGWMA